METGKKASTKPSAPRADANLRNSGEKDANIANTTRSSAVSARATGNTISKPPTRPSVASAKKASADEGPSGTRRQEERARRTPAVDPKARAVQPTDRTRRTTLGATATSVPPKRPLATSRTSTASPTTQRSNTPSTTRAPSSRTTKPLSSPTNASSKSTASIPQAISRNVIPEEPEETGSVSSVPSQVDGKHPPKLEIRSMASGTPALKPQALSDNEGRPRLLPRHSRTQSAVLPGRPTTAPMPTMTEQQQSMREMEVLSNLLRESTRRDSMAVEIADLRSEISKLERKNKALTEAAVRSPELRPKGLVEGASNSERELKVMLRSQHLAEIETMKGSHKDALSSLEQHHANELETLRSELDSQRRASSHLVGVETRIQAVESALRESKQRASQSEQELQEKLQEKDQDKDQLGTVIANLKEEIGRCQLKLNADVAEQAREKKEADKARETLKRELDEERSKLEQATKEKSGEAERVKSAVEQARQGMQPELERLKKAAKSAGEVGEKVKAEMERMRKETQSITDRETKASAESAETIAKLLEEIERHKKEHNGFADEQKGRFEAEEKITGNLRSELEDLQRRHEGEQEKSKKSREEQDAAIKELRQELKKLQQDGVDGAQIVQELQRQLQEAQRSKADMQEEHAAASTELEGLRSTIAKLEAESTGLKGEVQRAVTTHEAESSRTKDLEEAAKKAEEKTDDLQRQLDEALQHRDETMQKLDRYGEDLEASRIELKSVGEETLRQLAEKEKEHDELATNLSASQEENRKAVSDLEMARHEADAAIEELKAVQNELQKSRDDILDEQRARSEVERKAEEVTKDLECMQSKHESLDELRLRHGQMLSAAHTHIQEVEAKLTTADTRVAAATSELASMKGELDAMSTLLNESSAGMVTNKADHVIALEKQQKEHDDRLASIEAKHAEELARISANGTTAAEKDAESARMLETLKHEHEERISEVLEKHRVAIEESRNRHETQAARSLGNLKHEHEEHISAVSEEHRVAVQELSSNHEAAEKLWKQKLDAMDAEKEALAKALADLASGDEAIEDELAKAQDINRGLQEQVQQLEMRLVDDTEQHETSVQSLRAAVTAVKAEHEVALKDLAESLSGEHGRKVQAVMDEHARKVAEIEQQASRRAEESGLERDRVHEMQLATQEAVHADMLREAMHAPSTSQEDAGKVEDGTVEPETPSKSGLSHVFVNREARATKGSASPVKEHEDDNQDGEPMPQLAETPLAYASEEEKDFSFSGSPTPGAHETRPSSARLRVGARPRRQDLEQRNADLENLLAAAKEEIGQLKKGPEASERATSEKIIEAAAPSAVKKHPTDLSADTVLDTTLPPTTPSALQPPQPLHQHTNIDNNNHIHGRDVFSSPRSSLLASDSSFSLLSSPPHFRERWNGEMTLEGTLKSIRVQAEQLLEINEDFLAEHERWERRRSGGIGRRSGGRGGVGVGGKG
ncbi:hypothetical protein LTR62_003606 [Meristemomyces frigidus]|uniref:Uncharacterized protein n=1 Tax=Meristemomyces frigidus TaxID=1508187 RepID=A0AAN7YKK5_9PEZI|nr:hypothetical protein LTR62_003606 [Meristemomyces frigidus]